MDIFENYAFVAIKSDNVPFYTCKIIKVTSGFNLKKKKKIRQVAPTSKNQLKYFSNTNNSTILTLPGPPGVSREAKSSTEFEFGSLVRYIWAQNGETSKNRRKTIIFCCFSCHF